MLISFFSLIWIVLPRFGQDENVNSDLNGAN